MEQITLVYITDPFHPLESRTITQVDCGATIEEHLKNFLLVEKVMEGCELKVHYKNEIVEDYSIIPKPNEIIHFCVIPKGDEIGSILLTVLAAVATYYIGGKGALFVKSLGLFKAGSLSAYMLASGVTLAGGALINAVFDSKLPSLEVDSGSTNYRWGPGENKAYEGGVVPVLYGKHKVFPYFIGSYVDIVDDKEYLNALYIIADHELSNLGTSAEPYYVEDVKLNDTDINEFDEVYYEVRHGELNQEPLEGFEDTRVDTVVGASGLLLEVGEYTTHTTSGTIIDGLGFTINAPKGFYTLDTTKGHFRDLIAKIEIQYKKTTEATWTTLYSPVTEKTTVVIGRWSLGYMERPEPSDVGVGSRYWVEVAQGSENPDDPAYAEGKPESFEDYGLNAHALRTTAKYLTWSWIYSKEILTIGTEVPYVIFKSRSSSPVRKRWYSVKFKDYSSYNVRVKIIEYNATWWESEPLYELPEGPKYCGDLYFDSVQEITSGTAFIYPGTSMFALRALANEQLANTLPTLSLVASRDTVSIWNPTTEAYENKSATNPAYACLDVLHNPHYGGDFDRELSIYSDFTQWAEENDETMGDWEDGSWCTEGLDEYDPTDPMYEVNYYFDTELNCKEACDYIGRLANGAVIQIGNKFSCAVERPETPTQRFMFSIGNIIKDSFEQEFLPMEGRANVVEISYWDKELDYERDTVQLRIGNSDDQEEVISSIELQGCVRRDMAIRFGMRVLNAARYLTIMASFEASVDSIHCMPGDIIDVQHDVPEWGSGGRIVSATATTVTLDQDVSLYLGETYAIKIKHSDDTVDIRTVINELPDTTRVIEVSAAWSQIPEAFCIYQFGPTDRVSMLMRVMSITRGEDLRRKIVALEFIPEVYDDCAIIPTYTPTSDLEYCMKHIGHIEYWNDDLRTIVSRIYWDGKGPSFEVSYSYYSEEDDLWTPWAFWGVTAERFVDIPGLPNGFQGRISVKCHQKISNSVTVEFQHTGMTQSTVIDLPNLTSPKLYFNINPDGSVAHARFECTVSIEDESQPDGILLFYSVDPIANKLSNLWGNWESGDGYDYIGVGIADDILSITEPGTLYDILETVDEYTMVITTENAPNSGEPGGGTFDGSMWVQIARDYGEATQQNTKWNLVSHYTTTSLVFKKAFVFADDPDTEFTPQPGDKWIFAQLAWKDIREPEWRLGFVYQKDSNGDPVNTNYEIIQYGDLDHISFYDIEEDQEEHYVYLDRCFRAKEGTEQIDIGNTYNCAMYYYPAIGPGSNMVALEANKFVHIGDTDIDFRFSADVNLNIPMLRGMWGAVTCCAFKIVKPHQGNPTGIRRSNIVPVEYGGGI